jgi:hypothetical protein
MNLSYTFGDRPIPNGIASETATILKNVYLSPGVITALQKMKPIRQIEAAEHIALSGNYSVTFAQGLLAITKPELLLTRVNRGCVSFRYAKRVRTLQQAAWDVHSKLACFRESYGRDVLTLTVYCRFLERLLSNSPVVAYLSQFHPETLSSLRLAVLTAKEKITKRHRKVPSIERSRNRLT